MSGYVDLQNRVAQYLKSAKVQDRVFEAFKLEFEKFLASESIVLSRAERKRLLAQAIKRVLGDMIEELGDA